MCFYGSAGSNENSHVATGKVQVSGAGRSYIVIAEDYRLRRETDSRAGSGHSGGASIGYGDRKQVDRGDLNRSVISGNVPRQLQIGRGKLDVTVGWYRIRRIRLPENYVTWIGAAFEED